MSIHQKTQAMLDVARAVLESDHPMTVRQVYYQLVSRQVIENNKGRYQAVSDVLVYARKNNLIPWDWIEDRLRRPRSVSMWSDLSDFGATVLSAYRRDIWESQPGYVEVWLEKDALSGIFEDILNRYGVTLNVGRGYDGWDSIRNAARRYGDGDNTTILYFGDFDPSGEDMVRSLEERLGFFGCRPSIRKCALNLDDIRRYNLPPDFTKKSDSRRKKFVDQYGDVSVELDALPIDVLRSRIRKEVEAQIDLGALETTLEKEDHERLVLKSLLGRLT
jgi:hypothetical protein